MSQSVVQHARQSSRSLLPSRNGAPFPLPGKLRYAESLKRQQATQEHHIRTESQEEINRMPPAAMQRVDERSAVLPVSITSPVVPSPPATFASSMSKSLFSPSSNFSSGQTNGPTPAFALSSINALYMSLTPLTTTIASPDESWEQIQRMVSAGSSTSTPKGPVRALSGHSNAPLSATGSNGSTTDDEFYVVSGSATPARTESHPPSPTLLCQTVSASMMQLSRMRSQSSTPKLTNEEWSLL